MHGHQYTGGGRCEESIDGVITGSHENGDVGNECNEYMTLSIGTEEHFRERVYSKPNAVE